MYATKFFTAVLFATVAAHAGCLTAQQQDAASVAAEQAFARGDSAAAWVAWDAANMNSSACQLPGVAFLQAATHERNAEQAVQFAAAEIPAPTERVSRMHLTGSAPIATRAAVVVRMPAGCGAQWCAAEEN